MSKLHMQDFQNLDTQVLIDMLAKHTVEYTRMLSTNERSEEFNTCEMAIYLLQGEINSRISKTGNTSISGADLKFTVDNN